MHSACLPSGTHTPVYHKELLRCERRVDARPHPPRRPTNLQNPVAQDALSSALAAALQKARAARSQTKESHLRRLNNPQSSNHRTLFAATPGLRASEAEPLTKQARSLHASISSVRLYATDQSTVSIDTKDAGPTIHAAMREPHLRRESASVT